MPHPKQSHDTKDKQRNNACNPTPANRTKKSCNDIKQCQKRNCGAERWNPPTDKSILNFAIGLSRFGHFSASCSRHCDILFMYSSKDWYGRRLFDYLPCPTNSKINSGKHQREKRKCNICDNLNPCRRAFFDTKQSHPTKHTYAC